MRLLVGLSVCHNLFFFYIGGKFQFQAPVGANDVGLLYIFTEMLEGVGL